MKKMILGLAALLLVTLTFAQHPGGHHKGRHRHGSELMKLNLSDAQKQQMKSFNENFRKQMASLNGKEDITVKEQRDQRAALVKAHKAQVENVLTPEQKTQLVQVKAEAKKKRQEMAARHLDKMKEKLNLSDGQVATIKSSQDKTKGKIEAVMQDERLERADKRDQLMALKEEMKNDMQNVLTAEQKTKMEEMKKERHQKMKDLKDKRMDDTK